MYGPVDLAEQFTTNAATGSTVQGEASCNTIPHVCVYIIQCTDVPHLVVGIPANPKWDHHWVKRKSTKRVFCQQIFNSNQRFFVHHQIDLAQRDGKKILLSMFTAVSRLFCLDFDFPEIYTHINQVFILATTTLA